MKFPHHPLKLEWQALQWGMLILPFNPILSLPGLLFTLFSVWKKQFKLLINFNVSKALGLLTIWLILTTLLAENKGEAALGLANFIPYFGLFLAYHLVIQDFSRLRKLAWCLLLPSLPMSLLGLGQVYGGWHSPEWLGALGTNLIAGGIPEGRISSLLMYANIFSAYLLMLLPLNLGFGIEAFKQWQQDKTQVSLRKFIGLGLLALLNIIAIFLTDSRSAWAISFVIILAYAFYLTWYWLIGGAIALASVIAWASWGLFWKEPFRLIVPNYIWGRLSDELYPDRYMTAFRSTQWDFVWEMMLNRPIFGWGLRNFTPLYQAKMNIWLGHPHNLPLMLLGEIGIPGTLLFLGLVGFILYQATRLLLILGNYHQSPRRQKEYLLLLSYLVAFASVSAYNLLDVTIFDIRVNILGWVLLAAIAGIT
ncbi:MAG: O-antigen ligase family protein, partial [Microcystaceae cyanobacterium]